MMHVVDPAYPEYCSHAKPWCCGNGDTTTMGTVDCPDCIALLVEHPGYYNQLRARGLRTQAERDWEEEQEGGEDGKG